MIETIFIEEQVIEHPNSKLILKRLKKANVIEINRYQELFNKRQQNFRLQKKRPALILAKKHENFVLPAPTGFGMDAEKNYYFSHGDDIELGNYSYKVYKSIVRSRLLKMVANDFFSFSFMERLGSKVSENSKQRNFKKYKENNFDKVIKEKFIRSAEAFYKKSLPQRKYDYIVCGHSHQKEFYKSQEGFYYLNNGLALQTKTFIFIENHSPEFIKLM